MSAAETSVRRTQSERRETAERQIVLAAIEIIAEKGLSGLTLAAAGENAGYSRGIASHHFGKKDELLIAIVRHITERFSVQVGEIQTVEPGLPMLLETIRQYFDRVTKDSRGIRALHMVLSEGINNPSLAAPIAHANEKSIKGIAYHIHIGQDAGDLRPDLIPRQQAIIILAGLRGVMAQWIIDPSDISLPDIREAFLNNVVRSLSV
ncbi:TetR/AcrR family transcriptional regulator [Aurantivibrio plasticivorans]